MSNTAFNSGTITQVSWPPSETPSTEYPSKPSPLRLTSARAFLYSSSSIARPIADRNPVLFRAFRGPVWVIFTWVSFGLWGGERDGKAEVVEMGVDGCMIRCGKVTYGMRERERESRGF